MHKIGSGAYGDVWLAKNKISGEKHAIKYVTTSTGSDREVEILQRLSHPNVLKIINVYRMGTTYIFASPVADMDLHHFMMRRGIIADPMAQTIARQICLGLNHIHSHHIMHRHLKPSNVLLSIDNPSRAAGSDGPDGFLVVVIADFGLARNMPPPPELMAGSYDEEITCHEPAECHSRVAGSGKRIPMMTVLVPCVLDHASHDHHAE